MTVSVSRRQDAFAEKRSISAISGFWPELNCHDVKAAISFYGRTAGWRFREVRLADGGSYWLALQAGKPLCGIHPLDPVLHAGIVPHWMNHAVVADLDGSLRAALFRGGKVLRPVHHVPGLGRLAVIVDGCGALLGFMEREEKGAMQDETVDGAMDSALAKADAARAGKPEAHPLLRAH